MTTEWRRRLVVPAKHTGLVLIGFVMLYPVLWMVVSSLRPGDEIFRSPGLVLDSLQTENYVEGWNALTPSFGTYLVNSAVLVLGCIVGNLVSCSMAAYAFARLQFTGKRWWFGIMLGTIMLPIHVIIVPQYVLFSQMGWVNTFLPLIVPKILATDAFFVFLMVQFIRGLPRELDEAARIDGCGHPRIFLQIVLPLMTPALATTTIFTFIWTWNDFFSQLIYLTDPDMYTVPVALRSFVDSTVATSWGSQFAMSVVSLVPIFLAFLIGQRYLVKGIATTGGK
ncbi:carbohydrate ABC transporter membrane protein 2, CUT1 family [Lentzea xinjiangensis]|uniref:Carbohydrate ABC transporter membrane protein 2, CUT1 family n=1 Tax=Lentzea xinjiangensis TaxID=402600 RepID=A0A1H9LTG3_9PSEU|nr:carbohydrate ABC transporter permease [Lentzea xinjiangensis]SER14751.1 carbohydrate ABC transporter membrane protein 2, CUT1 family [Lentzea xinjiangensis]